MATKRVCVIGAGMSGLGSIKACLEENLDVVCFEKTNTVGGLWKYRDNPIEGVGSVMESTILNTSKELTCFSDFPPPKSFPNYFPHFLMARYLEMYASHFRLHRHIRFETTVLSVKRSSSYEQDGRWIVIAEDKEKTLFEEHFDAVMICSGHHAYPYLPELNGLSQFTGEVYHTHKIKTGRPFKNKRVLVVGLGNSGSDVAVEISREAQKVLLSTRRGSWVNGRLAEGGVPLDIQFTKKVFAYIFRYSSYQLLNFIAEARANMRFNHNLYCLQPMHGFFQQHITVNDELPLRIISGLVEIKDDVHRFTDDGVIFREEEDSIHKIDAVVFATGYDIRFPYLEKDVLMMDDNHPLLYKYVFPKQMSHPSLAFIGLLQVQGPLTPLAEIQARWAVRVFKGLCHLPSESTMAADIDRKNWEIHQRFVGSKRHTIQVDYIWYQEEIAELIGVKPDLKYLLLSDPTLWWACMFGPCFPYFYRLIGPHQWKGARDAILTAQQRMMAPLKTRNVKEPVKTAILDNLFASPFFLILFAAFVTALLFLWH